MKNSFLLCLCLAMPFSGLCSHENEDVVEVSDELLQKAIQNNDPYLVEVLMKYGGDSLCPTLNKAMEAQDYRAVQILIEYGVDINSRKENHCISNIGNHKIEGYGRTVLEEAVEAGNIGLIEYFLSKNANPLSRRKYTNLFNTGKRIHQHWVYETTLYETTSMYDAIKSGKLNIVILFDQYGADLDAICYQDYCNHNGNTPKYTYLTPIKTAIKFGKKDIIDYLISRSVKI